MEDLGMKCKIELNFDQTRDKVIGLLKAEGFGVLTDVNVKETMKQKLNVDFINYEILGVCNPPLAHKAITANPDVGLLLPCNVILYDGGDGTYVNIIDPLSMVTFFKDEDLMVVATEARSKLQRVYQSLLS